MPECVEKLEIWQDGMKQAKAVYSLTGGWPKEEIYGLPRGICEYDPIPRGRRSQARRAVVSIPANLVQPVK